MNHSRMTMFLSLTCILIFFAVVLSITGCYEAQSTVKKEEVICNAVYRESSDGLNPTFEFESYWAKCYGRIGSSRPRCIWRQ